jgi:predicted ATPase
MSVFIERIKIKNLLSFDEEGIDFELKPLNVLIGANASGKSNFVLSLKILSGFSQYNVREIIEGLGGLYELRNKAHRTGQIEIATDFAFKSIEVRGSHKAILDETFGNDYRSFEIHNEELFVRLRNCIDEHWMPQQGKGIQFHIQVPEGKAMHYVRHNVPALEDKDYSNEIPVVIDGKPSSLSLSNFSDRSRSIILQGQHRYVIELRERLASCWKKGFYPVFGPSILQIPNEAGVFQDNLDPFGSNLASYLAVLNEKMIVDNYILPKVSEIYPKITGIGTTIKGGRVYITLKEKGNKQVTLQPRISDGILRLIAVLSVLYQDNPPPLLCLEEPENGLHPEVVQVLAKALKEASERTQLIITTHSAELLSYLDPEDIVTCERGESGGTKLSRLDRERLSEWRDDYSLGDLWLKGVLGGTRY